MDKRSPLDILSNPQHDSVYSSQHRSATVGDKQFRSLQKPPPVQDRSFRVKKYPHHDALSPLSKTQNSGTKGAPTDRDISGGFTYVNRNRPPTFDKTASGFRIKRLSKGIEIFLSPQIDLVQQAHTPVYVFKSRL